MSWSWHFSLCSAMVISHAFVGQAGDPPDTKTPKVGGAEATPAPPAPKGKEGHDANHLNLYDIGEQKLKELNANIDAFHASPTRDDFARLEQDIEFLRKSPLAANNGQMWPEWFYSNLCALEKRDSDSWNAQFAKFDRWIAAFPDSATPLIAKAKSHVQYGWQERGSGFANTVSEARWLIFHDQINRAHQLLDTAREKKNLDAEVYTTLVTVGMTEGAERETIDEYLKEAEKIHGHYFPLYEKIAVDLLPRWGGEPGDIGKFARQMLKEHPGEQGLEIYARIAAELNPYDLNLLLEGEFDLSQVHAGVKTLQFKYPNATYFQNFSGLVAWLNQDQELARLVRPVVEKDFVKNVWGTQDRRKQFLQFCSLSTPPHKPQRIVWSLSQFPSHTAISPSGNSLVVCYEGRRGSPFEIRSMKDLSLIDQISGYNLLPDAVAINPAGTKVAISYRALQQLGLPPALELYTVGEWKNPQFLGDERVNSFGALCFSPDGKLLAVAHQGLGLGLWNVEAGKLERVIEWKEHIQRIFFSLDGEHVAAQSDSAAQISEVATGKLIEQLPSGKNGDAIRLQTVLGYLPNGRLLAVLRRQTPGTSALVSWDRVTKKFATLIPDVPGAIPAVSPQLTFLITATTKREAGGQLAKVAFWSIPEKRKLAEYDVPGGANGFAFSQDEKTLTFSQMDQSVRIWDLSAFHPKSE